MRFAAFEPPMQESIEVTVEPIFCPRIIGMAAAHVIAPVVESACKIPTEAEELWSTAVTAAPASIPRSALSPRVENIFTITGESFKPLRELSICSIPINKTPKATIISPTILLFAFFPNITIAAPISARIGAKVVGFISWSKKLSPSTAVSRRICAVTVVPILEPIIIPIA